jgi:hypothetical protein
MRHQAFFCFHGASRERYQLDCGQLSRQAETLFKQMLVDYAGSYMSGGNRQLVQYDDQKQPLKLAEDFSALLKESTYVNDYAPELANYIDKFPTVQLPGSTTYIYWSKEQFGIQPVMSMTHVTIYSRKPETEAKQSSPPSKSTPATISSLLSHSQ